MPFPKLERVKAKHREASELLERMAAYIRHQVESGQEFVTPKLAAAAIGVNKGEAFVLLKMLEEAGLLRQQFNVYCRNQGILLKSVDTLDDLDKIQRCDFCDKQHHSNEFEVEIAFRPSQNLGASGLAA